ncbi:MAG: Vegetatible incompatibility protein HET-E-1, partial [uncultured Acetobacteraceae bacterium]
ERGAGRGLPARQPRRFARPRRLGGRRRLGARRGRGLRLRPRRRHCARRAARGDGGGLGERRGARRRRLPVPLRRRPRRLPIRRRRRAARARDGGGRRGRDRAPCALALGGTCGSPREWPPRRRCRQGPPPLRRERSGAEGPGAPVFRRRRRLRREGQARGGQPLQRRLALVRGLQGGQAPRAGMEGQPRRHRRQPGRDARGHGHAGERAARLALGGRAAHADVGLPRQNALALLHRARALAGDQRRRQRGDLAVPRRRTDGQGADGAGGWRRCVLHRGRVPSATRGGGRRFRGRAGAASRDRFRESDSGRPARPRRGVGSGLERRGFTPRLRHGNGLRGGGGPVAAV